MRTHRNVLYSVAMSLDGFIAGPNGEYDWIPDEDGIDFQVFLDRFDTLLMGRRTFQLTLEQGPEAEIPGMKRYVFSSTLKAEDHPDVTIVPPQQTLATVRQLKRDPGKDLWLFGGSHLFASLLDANLVDEVEVAVMPILLGEGIPLLQHEYAVHSLERIETSEFPSGLLLSRYRVVRAND